MALIAYKDNKSVQPMFVAVDTPTINTNADNAMYSTTVKYPDGFTKDNCFVAGILFGEYGDDTYWTTGNTSLRQNNTEKISTAISAVLFEDNISVRVRVTLAMRIKCRLILCKYL